MHPEQKENKIKNSSDTETPPSDSSELDLGGMSFFQLATVVYSIMASIGLLLSIYAHNNFWKAINIPNSSAEWIRIFSVTLLTTCILLVSARLADDWFPSFTRLKETLRPSIKNAGILGCIFLAVISGVAEELLFRAGIQPFTGLFIGSLLFGLLHIGPDHSISAWTVWAFLAGLLLGWTFEATGSLWPAIIAHVTVNSISLIRLQRSE